MRFLRDALITILLLGTIAVIGAYAVVRNGGLAANEKPNQLERSVAGQLVRLSIPPEADREQNPFSADAEAWRDARTHYVDHCAVCHGRDGRGATEIGQNMYPPVPDLTTHDSQARSDGALYYIIQNGIRWTGMPAWKEEHSPEETWRLVSFIRKAPSLTEADFDSVESTAVQGEQAPGREAERSGHRHPR